MGDHTAFFYGTLMAPEVLHRVCHGTSRPSAFQKSLLTIRPAILPGYARHKVRGCDYPAVIPCPPSPSSPPSSVRGTYVTGLTDGDIWRLDIFEGVEYERQEVEVRLLPLFGDDSRLGQGKGEEEEGKKEEEELEVVRAQTYVWMEGRKQLEEGEWDFEDFVKEKMKRWVGDEGEAEYEGELRPSIAEVDDAVKKKEAKEEGKGEKDPTGGRSLGGAITEALEKNGAAKDEILRSAT